MACNIVDTVERKACMTVTRASSSSNTSWQCVCGYWASRSVFNTVATVWCICLQIALAWGFLFIVGTGLMFNKHNSCWKAKPVNSPNLSWMTCIGWGYQESQVCLKCVSLWLLDSSKIFVILMKLVVVSIQVRAKNSTSPCGVDVSHGLVTSTVNSSLGAQAISWLGSNPWPGLVGFACWHLPHKNCPMCICRWGW